MFFDEYSRFIETSETTKDPTLLNVRHKGLIDANRNLIQGASILDLASHDGRWSFAALKAGATHVYGIDSRPRRIRKALQNMAHYKVRKDHYTFVCGDMFAEIPKITRKIDCIFVFGVFYHIVSHMLLIEMLSRLEAKYIIIDSVTSRLRPPVIQFKKELGKTRLVGHPSKAAIVAMLSYYGWACREIDWMALLGDVKYTQYRSGRRITIVGQR
jgi:predicted RNA methylase